MKHLCTRRASKTEQQRGARRQETAQEISAQLAWDEVETVPVVKKELTLTACQQ
jgi:hypothetical protein